ncbi:MAG: ABC transporter permease, partial [Desulfofustis sp.]
MDLLVDSLRSALLLLLSFDRELIEIVEVSLNVSFFSTLFASIIGLPAGFFIAFNSFRGKRFLMTCLNTLLALPTVV